MDRSTYQAGLFIGQTIAGSAVTIYANMVLNEPDMVCAASVIASAFAIFICMSLLEVLVDLCMDLAGEPRLVACRRFTGWPRDVFVNAMLTGSGVVMISYSMKATRTPLPLQVMMQLLTNLIIAPAKVALIQFHKSLPIFSLPAIAVWRREGHEDISSLHPPHVSQEDMASDNDDADENVGRSRGATGYGSLITDTSIAQLQASEAARACSDARAFWRNYLLASAAFVVATVLTVVDRQRSLEVADGQSGKHHHAPASPNVEQEATAFNWYPALYVLGNIVMGLAQIHADGTLSGAEEAAASLTRRTMQPSKWELVRQGLNFGTSKQLWRVFISLAMIPISLAWQGVDTADVPTTWDSIRVTFDAIFGLQSFTVGAFVIVSTLQASFEPLMNAEDASLNAASQNTQSILIIALGWIPALRAVTAGYAPSTELTLPAVVLVLLGSVPLARFSAIVQRYHHGDILTAPDEPTALRLAEASRRQSVAASLDDLHGLLHDACVSSRPMFPAENFPLATTGLGTVSRAMSPVMSYATLPPDVESGPHFRDEGRTRRSTVHHEASPLLPQHEPTARRLEPH